MSRSPTRIVISSKGKISSRRKIQSPVLGRTESEKILSASPKSHASYPTSPSSYNLSKVLFQTKPRKSSHVSKKPFLRKSAGSEPVPETLLLDFQTHVLKCEIDSLQQTVTKCLRARELEDELNAYRGLVGQLNARMEFYKDVMGRIEENCEDEVGLVKMGVELRRSLGEENSEDLFGVIQKAADRLETWKTRTFL